MLKTSHCKWSEFGVPIPLAGQHGGGTRRAVRVSPDANRLSPDRGAHGRRRAGTHDNECPTPGPGQAAWSLSGSPEVLPAVPRQRCPPQCPRQDSNLRTRLRRPVLYPLSYEGATAHDSEAPTSFPRRERPPLSGRRPGLRPWSRQCPLCRDLLAPAIVDALVGSRAAAGRGNGPPRASGPSGARRLVDQRGLHGRPSGGLPATAGGRAACRLAASGAAAARAGRRGGRSRLCQLPSRRRLAPRGAAPGGGGGRGGLRPA